MNRYEFGRRSRKRRGRKRRGHKKRGGVERCKRKNIVDPLRNNKCIKVKRHKPSSRGARIANYLDNALEQWKAQELAKGWTKYPGEKGFNSYAHRKMKQAKLKLELKCGGSPFAYQTTVSFCLHPSTTIDRMLVVHKIGSGKTRSMITIAENYYNDPRPKVLIFPTGAVANNFYLQLMDNDNKYSQAVLEKIPDARKLLEDRKTYSDTLQKVKDILAMTGELGKYKRGLVSRSPLRAYSYATAGGTSIFNDDKPNDPIFKLLYNGKGHEYSNKIVLMDEAHNLITPSLRIMKYSENLIKLKEALKRSKDTVFGAFTATPLVDGMDKAKELLSVVKGTTPRGEKNDEGYISYFGEDQVPRAIYPRIKITKMYITIPKRSNDRTKLGKSTKPNSNYEAYVRAFVNRPRTGKDLKPSQIERSIYKMCNHMNMSSYFTRTDDWKKDFKNDPKRWGAKMFHVIQDIEDHKMKSLILIHRRTGFKALIEAFNMISKAQLFPNCDFCFAKAYDKDDSEFVKEFSKDNNRHGNKIKVFIADSSTHAEGISFLNVRKCYLFNPPLTYSGYIQLRGRVIRACTSHIPLPKPQREVEIINCIGQVSGFKSIDEFLMDKIEKEGEGYDKKMKFFKDLAIDKKILTKFFKKSDRKN